MTTEHLRLTLCLYETAYHAGRQSERWLHASPTLVWGLMGEQTVPKAIAATPWALRDERLQSAWVAGWVAGLQNVRDPWEVVQDHPAAEGLDVVRTAKLDPQALGFAIAFVDGTEMHLMGLVDWTWGRP